MLCDNCGKNEAVMQYTEVKNNAAQTRFFCQDCADEKGLSGSLGAAIFSLGELLNGMMKDIVPAVGQPEMTACPRCGMILSDFRKSGRLGCAGCYRAFAPVLRPMLRQIHGTARHLGKTPAIAPRAFAPDCGDRLPALRKELAEAVGREQFEIAASLRDQIRLLESEQAVKTGNA